MKQNRKPQFEDDFDLIKFGIEIWRIRKWVMATALIFCIISVLYVLLIPKTYETSVSLMTNKSSGDTGMKGLSGLASLAGITTSSVSSGISASTYPLIVNSLPFKMELLKERITFSSLDTTLILKDYFLYFEQPSPSDVFKKYTINLPKTIWKLIKGTGAVDQSVEESSTTINNGIYELAFQDFRALSSLVNKYTLTNSAESGLIYIVVNMQDPQASAELNVLLTKLLKKNIVEYNISKSKEDLARVQIAYDEAKSNYLKAQLALANFVDGNQRVSSQEANIKKQSLQNEFNIAFSIFNSLSTQLEQAKIALTQDTPTFSIFEPVVLPNKPVDQKPILIVIVASLFGAILSVGVIFLFSFGRVIYNMFLRISD